MLLQENERGSRQIKTLESYIQVPLFRRTGRRVEITEEGLELLPAVRSGLDELESAVHLIKQHGRAGPLQISLLTSFLQIWLLPRIRSSRRKFPDVDLRFHSSPQLVDFSRMIKRGADLSKFPLLEGDEPPWRIWQRTDEEIAWQSRPPTIDDSAGLMVAAEEGLGFALSRWTMVTRSLQKGTLQLAGKEALSYGSAYYFVCPRAFLTLPKVAQFREWIVAAAREFRGPEAALGRVSKRRREAVDPSRGGYNRGS